MTAILVDQASPEVLSWLGQKCGTEFHAPDARTIALIRDGEIVSACALTHWTTNTVEATIGSSGPTTRDFIFVCLDYAFRHAGKGVMYAYTRPTNARSLRVQKALGFKKVGLLLDHFAPGDHAVLQSLTRDVWVSGSFCSPSVNRSQEREGTP